MDDSRVAPTPSHLRPPLEHTHTHTHTRARARARAHTRTHAHTHTHRHHTITTVTAPYTHRPHIVPTPSPHRPHTVPTPLPHRPHTVPTHRHHTVTMPGIPQSCPPNLSSQYLCGTRCRGVLGLGPYGCRVALQINSCCAVPVSAAYGRACGVEWAAHARHVARATKPKRPVVTGVAMPGCRLSRRGCFRTKGSSLNDRGAGRRLRRL